MTALGRVGKPDDIGSAIAALRSDGMGWVSGVRIEVSGGQSLSIAAKRQVARFRRCLRWRQALMPHHPGA
jgi:NAD(P)-dependent dehydrogenase (short-subunit alcohol dehydrogenase family)